MAAHVVIAGTGRSGTSFLLQFLDACGLETLSDEAVWYPQARAGGERHLRAGMHLPYVIKDPWFFTYCQELDLDETRIEALIVPIRDLMLSAQSRVHQERLTVLERWFGGEPQDHQVLGATPGGILYSLDVVDQARILAVGFHKLLQWATDHEISLYLLSFPRLVEDVDYLLRILSPWLSDHCDEARAREAFEQTAAADAIRIRRAPEVNAVSGVPLETAEPNPHELDRHALLELLIELRSQSERGAAAAEELQMIHDSPMWRIANRVSGQFWYRALRFILTRGRAKP